MAFIFTQMQFKEKKTHVYKLSSEWKKEGKFVKRIQAWYTQSQKMVKSNDDVIAKEAEKEQGPVKKRRIMGPMRPPVETKESIEEEEMIGPSLPGQMGHRMPSYATEKAMEEKEQQIERDAWNQVEKKNDKKKSSGVVREAWMNLMPQDESLAAALGSRGDNKPRQFAT